MLQWILFHWFNLKYASLLNCFQRDIYCFHLFMCFEIKCAIPSVSPITSKKLPLARNLRVIMTCCSTVRAWFLLVSLSNQIWQKHNALPAKPVSFSEFFICKIKGKSIFISKMFFSASMWNMEPSKGGHI